MTWGWENTDLISLKQLQSMFWATQLGCCRNEFLKLKKSSHFSTCDSFFLSSMVILNGLLFKWLLTRLQTQIVQDWKSCWNNGDSHL